jgi:hypothetical protein
LEVTIAGVAVIPVDVVNLSLVVMVEGLSTVGTTATLSFE